MNIENCPEYTIGFCPFEEFHEAKLTMECPFIHSKDERNEYFNSNKPWPFEKSTLAKLKEIVNQVDRKTEMNIKIANQERVPTDLIEALVETQSQIEKFESKSSDFEKLHSLLIIHGQLIKYWNEHCSSHIIGVCTVCGALKHADKLCEHKFCKKHKVLREIVARLEKKIKSIVQEKEIYLQ